MGGWKFDKEQEVELKILIDDEGVPLGLADEIDFVGELVSVSLVGSKATVTVADPERLALTLENENAGALVIGAAVYSSSAGKIDKAKADAAATAGAIGLLKENIGIGASGKVVTNGALTATTAQWDAVTGDAGGLIAGGLYFVDPTTAGKITKTAPIAIGQYVTKIGRAVSTTKMIVEVEVEVLL